MTDLISLYGAIREFGFSVQSISETGQLKIGANLWECPELYIKNSPVIFANRVTTPILIQHNKADNAVPWSQGLEWFMALRRLGKPVWMLQYDGEMHGLNQEKNQIDYVKRLEQFLIII